MKIERRRKICNFFYQIKEEAASIERQFMDADVAYTKNANIVNAATACGLEWCGGVDPTTGEKCFKLFDYNRGRDEHDA